MDENVMKGVQDGYRNFSGMVSLMRVEAARSPTTGLYDFTAIMAEEDGAEWRIPIGEWSLLSYERFQATVLKTTGRMFTVLTCDGRPSEIADEQFRWIVRQTLERTGPTAADIAPTN